MRVLEIITESKQQQIDELDLKKVGTAIGKGVSATTQGLGAVAGGVAGIPGAFKKGFQAGKNIVGGSSQQASKDTTFQYVDPATKNKTTIAVDSSGNYFKVDPSDNSKNPITDPAELSAVAKQDPKRKTKTTSKSSSGSKTSVGGSVASNTVTADPQKITLKQIKQVVDKMRKRDRDSLMAYLQSKDTASTTTATTQPPTPTKPALSVAV